MPEATLAPSPSPHIWGADRTPRVGWGTAYGALLRWQLARIGGMLPMTILVQAFLAGGLIVGYGFLIPDITPASALFLTTGAPTVLLMTVGLVIVPQAVAQARADGTFTFLRTLPVPRPLLLAAELTVWSVVALPSIGAAVGVGWLRFDLVLSIDWPVLITTGIAVTITSAAVGYAIAVLLQPLLAQLVSQALIFLVLLFSPVSFPASQLPAWFAAVHDWLPIRPAADLLRAGLASGAYDASLRDLAVLAAWCAAGVAVSVRALVRRA